MPLCNALTSPPQTQENVFTLSILVDAEAKAVDHFRIYKEVGLRHAAPPDTGQEAAWFVEGCPNAGFDNIETLIACVTCHGGTALIRRRFYYDSGLKKGVSLVRVAGTGTLPSP